MRSSTVCVAVVLMLGCGGSVDSTGGGGAGAGGGTGGSGTGASGTGGSGTGGGGGVGCPKAPPAHGAPCNLPSSGGGLDFAQCSWGDDPRPACRTTAICQNGSWQVTGPDAVTCSAPPLPPACGTTPPTPGVACDDSTVDCWFGDGDHCWCSECKGGSPYPVCQTIDPPEWACSSPSDGCPATIPQAGSACGTPGLSCGPNCELEVICQDGAWVWRHGNCPICASPETPIATPSGDRPIAELRAGDLVYSVDGDAIVAVPILRVASTPVTRHHVMRVTLQGGAVLAISPGHPTADGRTFADLAPGSALDGRQVVQSELVPYREARTYDILPASKSATYFAAGARIGSTLAH